VPAREALGADLDGQMLLLGPTVRVKRRLHFRYADALPVADCTRLKILDRWRCGRTGRRLARRSCRSRGWRRCWCCNGGSPCGRMNNSSASELSH
jgi:hypothetical protein